MPKSVNCEVCGDRVDTRGLSAHMEKHDRQSVVVESGKGERSLVETMADENSVIVRQAREIRIYDDELKRKAVGQGLQIFEQGDGEW